MTSWIWTVIFFAVIAVLAIIGYFISDGKIRSSMKRTKNTLTKGQAVFLLVVGLLLGTVFVFGMQYWNSSVKQEDAIHTEAIFLSHKERFRNGHSKGIDCFFSDYEQLYIDGSCVTSELKEALDLLSPNTKTTLIIHPNADTVLEMSANGNTLLEFQEVQRKLSAEKNEFLILGLFCYTLSLYAFFHLILHRKQRS